MGYANSSDTRPCYLKSNQFRLAHRLLVGAATVQTHELNDAALRLLPRVRRIAASYLRRLPATFELQDFVQTGLVGRMTALKSFDAERGTPVEAYVERRVRGSTSRSHAELAAILEQQMPPDAMGQLLSADLGDRLTAALGQLPERQQVVISLSITSRSSRSRRLASCSV